MKKILVLVSFVLLVAVAFAQSPYQGAIVGWGTTGTQALTNIPTGDDFIAVASGFKYAVALRADGSIVTWGSNGLPPVGAHPTGTGYIAISAGEEHAVALHSNGSLVAWGKNNKGQCNVPAGNDYVKIAAGISHSLALKSNGTVVAWGDGGANLVVPAGHQFVDIAASKNTSFGINTSGEIVGWGTGWVGELNYPSGGGFVKISAKNLHATALRNDGTLFAWGNTAGNTTVPPGTYANMDSGWQANVALRTDGELVAFANMWSLGFVPAWVQELNISKFSCGWDYNLGIVGPDTPPDADGDGVPDHVDLYPNDPERAYLVSYPLASPTGWGTLAFEDMWPQKGDYDFNDLVMGYRIRTVLDADLKIKDIIGDFNLRAVGATFQNAFAIEFPFPVANVQAVLSSAQGVPYNMPLTQAGANSILKVISNTNDFVSVPGHDVFWNTQPEQPFYAPIEISFTITLDQPYDLNSAPAHGFWNPFLMVNRDPGHEVHLPGYPPTQNANATMFGMNDDTTNPGTGRYYKTSNNLPWALDLPLEWAYPIETKQITFGYLGFAPWAESGGTQYENWFELLPEQVNLENIYLP